MKQSAGLVVYKFVGNLCKVFLVHPGGPFWKNKDLGAWSIPKGEFTIEDPLEAAKREFFEETGQAISGHFVALTPIRQSSAKMVYAWMIYGDIDSENIKSIDIILEWPPKSGKKISIPEIDKGCWFDLHEARHKIIKGQVDFLEQLEKYLHKEIGV